jgi:putative ATP-dependent endonuclease of OLD family
VACIGDLDVVPNDIDYVQGRQDKLRAGIKPKDGGEHPKRKAEDYTAEERAELLQRKIDRAKGGSTEVFISDHWTLEYDLLSSGLGKASYCALQLAKAEGSKGFLTKAKYDVALKDAEEEYDELADNFPAETIAAHAYQALHQKSVSKAIVAQYLAALVTSSRYGAGDAFYALLPPYLQSALDHLVPKAAP